jgi:hypothetical protein
MVSSSSSNRSKIAGRNRVLDLMDEKRGRDPSQLKHASSHFGDDMQTCRHAETRLDDAASKRSNRRIDIDPAENSKFSRYWSFI